LSCKAIGGDDYTHLFPTASPGLEGEKNYLNLEDVDVELGVWVVGERRCKGIAMVGQTRDEIL
jgi:hypothetical protein